MLMILAVANDSGWSWTPSNTVGASALALVFLVQIALDQISFHLRLSMLVEHAAVAISGGMIVLALYLLGINPIPLLFAVAIARYAITVPLRYALTASVVFGAALMAVYCCRFPWTRALPGALSYTALVSCSALLMHGMASAMRGEAALALANTALSRANAELQSMHAFTEEAVRDRERLRIARDLHDVTGHKLTALQINLQILEEQWPESRVVRTAGRLSSELLEDTRNIVRQMSNAAGLSIRDALIRLIELLPNTRVEVDVEPLLRIQNGEVARVLLSAAQEGLANALRHGQSSKVLISLHRYGDRLVLRVLDNGCGMATGPRGFGLQNLNLRVEALHGSLALVGAPVGGTLLEISVPEEPAENDHEPV
ncbi:MAG: hypothetical protein JNN30_08090 [Rhodanobacteraceae bacterium]|nr:hypothetical protein [Rhodanobacteraceae bacterium]